MTTIHISRVRVRAQTAGGEFGRDIKFKGGLNILRAENSLGKSTIINAILFGLGLEGAYTPEHAPPLADAMTKELESEGSAYKVTSSYVGMELTNHKEEKLTVIRRIEDRQGSTLISTWRGHVLDATDRPGQRDFFVRIPGAAQQENGFHHFMAKYLGLSLPLVERFDKPPTILWLELLVPFFFVEQKIGWSGIAKMTSPLGIRRAFQQAFEYLMALDTRENRQRRLHYAELMSRHHADWRSARELASSIARGVNGGISGIPSSLADDTFDPDEANLTLVRGATEVTIEKEIVRIQARIRGLSQDVAPPVGTVLEPRRKDLLSKTDALAKVELESQELSGALSRDEAEISASTRRLEAIEADLVRYRGLVRLKDRGSTTALPLEISVCPVCSQEMHDSVMPHDATFASLTLDDNVKVLSDQRDSIRAIQSALHEKARRRTQHLRSVQEQADLLRAEIRSLKELLVSNPQSPALDKLRERVRSEEDLKRLRSAKETFDTTLVRLEDAATAYAEAQKELANLPPGEFSDSDEAKLRALQERLRSQLREYGFTSLRPDEVDISWDTYRVVSDENDITFRVSASDMVRANWAYLVGLFELSREGKTNLPNLLVLDEPSQQKQREASVAALVRRLSKTPKHQQAIVATSEPQERWAGLRPGVDFHHIELVDYLLQPLSGGATKASLVLGV